ncbi:hypothetical protein HZ326_18968 [Fusarium oxysporum f. sp. albedinis]|nr:hypothetical protein HZ326_18968 [Fusarium oxysporum f. sp. albedinis]
MLNFCKILVVRIRSPKPYHSYRVCGGKALTRLLGTHAWSNENQCWFEDYIEHKVSGIWIPRMPRRREQALVPHARAYYDTCSTPRG